MIILKATKKQGFTPSLENTVYSFGRRGRGVTDPAVFLRLTFDSFYIIVSSSPKLQELE